MYNKETNLFDVPQGKAQTSGRGSHGKNLFVAAGLKDAARTLSGNGALKYAEMDNAFVTQFGSMSGWLKPRTYDKVATDMSELWAIDPELAVRFALYARMVTRKTKVNGATTEKSQKGQGLRNEGLLRMLWLGINHPKTFEKNAWLLPVVGRWKDIFDLLRYDLLRNGQGWNGRQLNWNFMAHLIIEGLKSDQKDLVKKYLPAIRSKSECKTPHQQANHIIGAWLSSTLFSNSIDLKESRYKRYRELKASGKAHTWQKALSTKNFNAIDFDKISGRALNLLAKGKFLSNHGLVDKYRSWIGDKPAAKYTGYVHELFKNIPRDNYKQMTINKQFAGLVQAAGKVEGNNTWLSVIDISGSMSSHVQDVGMSALDVAKGLALYMSHLLPEGPFSQAYMTFMSYSKLNQWRGSTPIDQFNSLRTGGIGSTNFRSIGQFFVNLKRQGVTEDQFPTGIVCFSDGEFNNVGNHQTNFEAVKNDLRRGGFSKDYVDNFMIVLWDIRSSYYGSRRTAKFEVHSATTDGLIHVSGYDGALLSFLIGEGEKVVDPTTGKVKTPRTPLDLFNLAINQEILTMVRI